MIFHIIDSCFNIRKESISRTVDFLFFGFFYFPGLGAWSQFAHVVRG
jgi:hypothetical protein